MISDGAWTTRRERKKRIQQPRYRRECFGELIQIDGCLHHWFEDRGPPCTVLVYVDDATGRLMELRFARSESTFDYFESTQSYLERHGRPGRWAMARVAIASELGGSLAPLQYWQATEQRGRLGPVNVVEVLATTPGLVVECGRLRVLGLDMDGLTELPWKLT